MLGSVHESKLPLYGNASGAFLRIAYVPWDMFLHPASLVGAVMQEPLYYCGLD